MFSTFHHLAWNQRLLLSFALVQAITKYYCVKDEYSKLMICSHDPEFHPIKKKNNKTRKMLFEILKIFVILRTKLPWAKICTMNWLQLRSTTATESHGRKRKMLNQKPLKKTEKVILNYCCFKHLLLSNSKVLKHKSMNKGKKIAVIFWKNQWPERKKLQKKELFFLTFSGLEYLWYFIMHYFLLFSVSLKILFFTIWLQQIFFLDILQKQVHTATPQ